MALAQTFSPVVTRWPKQLGAGEAIASWSAFVSKTGDATGGAVVLSLAISRIFVGFRGIWVVDEVQMLDTTASQQLVDVRHTAGFNRRLEGDLRQTATMVATASGSNSARFTGLRALIEPDNVAAQEVLAFQWVTNTDTKVYQVSVVGYVWDAEKWARDGYQRVYGLHR